MPPRLVCCGDSIMAGCIHGGRDLSTKGTKDTKRVSKKWGHVLTASSVRSWRISTGGLRQLLVVLAQPPAPSQPGKSAFHHPTARKNHGCAVQVGAVPTPVSITDVPSPFRLATPRVEPGKPTLQTGFAPSRSCQQDALQHPGDDDVTLAACHLLTRIIGEAPFFRRLDALAINDGCARTRLSSRLCAPCRAMLHGLSPRFRPFAKCGSNETPCAKGAGREAASGHPLRSTYMMAFTTSRRGYLTGRPPGLGGGNRASSCHLVFEIAGIGLSVPASPTPMYSIMCPLFRGLWFRG